MAHVVCYLEYVVHHSATFYIQHSAFSLLFVDDENVSDKTTRAQESNVSFVQSWEQMNLGGRIVVEPIFDVTLTGMLGKTNK